MGGATAEALLAFARDPHAAAMTLNLARAISIIDVTHSKAANASSHIGVASTTSTATAADVAASVGKENEEVPAMVKPLQNAVVVFSGRMQLQTSAEAEARVIQLGTHHSS